MKNRKPLFVVLVVVIAFLFSCKNKNSQDESITTGKTKILVDDSLFPVVEDQKTVFENRYKAEITLIKKSETEVINLLTKDTASIAIMSRKLNAEELKVFDAKKLTPKETIFARDAVVFVTNKISNDTLLDIADLVSVLNGNKNSKIKGLVFDNLNSSTIRLLMEVANVNVTPQENIFSFATSAEVMKYVAENEGMVGVIGVNWMSQPPVILKEKVSSLAMMSVKPLGGTEYIYPSQQNIGIKKYPLARDLYIINCQPFAGLGMGFASFIAGERGQRIVLQSGLVPVRYPSRLIISRKEIEKK